MQYHTPRKPTKAERDELIGYLVTTAVETDQAMGIIGQELYIAVFDHYITNGPGYAGKLMIVVGSDGPEYYQTFIWNKEGVICPINQAHEMSF